MRQPLENYAHNLHAVADDAVDDPPRRRQIQLPEIVDPIILDVFTGNLLGRDALASRLSANLRGLAKIILTFSLTFLDDCLSYWDAERTTSVYHPADSSHP